MATALVALASTTLSSGAYSIVFSGIASTYRDLQLVVTGTASGSANMTINFNSDYTGGNYPAIYFGSDGSSVSSGSINGYVGGIYGTNVTTNTITIPDYAQTDKQKVYFSRLSAPSGASSAIAGRWTNTAAINAIQFSLGGSQFSTGTTVTLFGVLA